MAVFALKPQLYERIDSFALLEAEKMFDYQLKVLKKD
jgi:hypothetical protein